MTYEPRNCSNGGKWPPPVHDECLRNVAWDISRRVYKANAQVGGWNRDRCNGIYRTKADSNYTGPWKTCQELR